MGDEEVEYKAEYLDTAEDAEPEVGNDCLLCCECFENLACSFFLSMLHQDHLRNYTFSMYIRYHDLRLRAS